MICCSGVRSHVLAVLVSVGVLAGCDGGSDSSDDTGPVAPSITTQPANRTVTEGQTATFSVTATGSGTLTYQWKRDAGNVTGGTGDTTASYTTPATVLVDSGAEFTCVVTNDLGSITSNAATLTVYPPGPRILLNPATLQGIYHLGVGRRRGRSA
jgi:hypothetical protein